MRVGWPNWLFWYGWAAAYVAHDADLRPLFISLFFAATLLQIWITWRGRLSLMEMLIGAVALRALFFPLPPLFSDDVFRYMWDGWLLMSG